jgi:hypothetical protein
MSSPADPQASAAKPNAPEAAATDGRAIPPARGTGTEREIAPRGTPVIAHVLGIAAALGFVALFVLMSEPSAPAPAPAPVAAAPDPSAAAPQGKKRERLRPAPPANLSVASAPSGGERMPVAVDSGFRRGVDATQSEASDLRPMHLAKGMVAVEENVERGVQFNRSSWLPVLRAGNAVFDQGVAMHAPQAGDAIVSFRVPESAVRFEATLALANEGSPHAKHCQSQGGSATFVVYLNGVQAYRKIVVGPDGPHEAVRLELNPAHKTLTLMVNAADGDNTCDGAVWGDAKFLVAPPTATAKTE